MIDVGAHGVVRDLRAAATIVVLALGLASVYPAGLRAQTDVRRELTRTPQGELLDFRPDGVWRRTVREIAARRAQLRGGAPPGMVVAEGVFVPAVSGVLSVPAIFFRFQDLGTGEVFSASDLEDRLFGASPPAGLPYTIRTYYDQMSGGLFRFEGQGVGWLTLDGNEEDYTGVPGTCLGNPFGTLNCNGLFSTDASIRRILGLTEAVQKADPLIDFGQFDNDGPDGVPNSGDDDGVVDLIAFYHSEQDGSCGGATNNHFWAHRSSLGGVATNDAAAGGGTIVVRDYVIQSGVGGSSGCDVASPVAIGTSAHEFGHGLALPDLYDVAGSSEGIGQWGLMGSGNWQTQESPARMTPWSLNELGWINIVDVTQSTSLTLPPITTSRTAYAIRPSDPNPRGEYLLFENRQGLLSDSAVVRAHCSTSGLLFPTTCGGGLAIWHVDSLKIASSMSVNQVNSGSIHGVSLVQADGLADLDAGSNRGDAGDVWPGITGAAVFDSSSSPAAVKNDDGSWLGFDLSEITQMVPHGDVSVDVTFPPPNALAVTPSHFNVTVTEGDVALVDETAPVEISGPGSGSIAWSATHGAAGWLTLTTDAGQGSGVVAWSRDPTGVEAGTHVDTITVTAAGVSGSPAHIVDTLTVVQSLVLTVTPASRSDTVPEGSTSVVSDSADVSFGGPGAGTATWSATHGGGSWLTLTNASGTGDGVVRWERDPNGLAAGVYVDTVSVTALGADGSPAIVVDTLIVQAPLVMSVSPSSTTDTIVEGAVNPVVDSASVSFSGPGAASANWTAVHGSGAWFTVLNGSGSGDATIRWVRNPNGLGEGVFVDTVTITSDGASGSPATVVDSLIVLPAPSLSASPDSVSMSGVEGAAPIGGSGSVSLSGTGAAAAEWSISHTEDWLALPDSAGTGPGAFTWSANLSGLVPGLYRDTMVVSTAGAMGSPVLIPVRLEVLQALTLSVSPTGKTVEVEEGSTTFIDDSASVSLTGSGAASAPWSVTHGGGNWLTLVTNAGTGSGTVAWQRDPTDLPAGVYVDTILVQADGAVGSPASVIDTMTVNAVNIPLEVALSPSRAHVSAVSGEAGAIVDSADVVLTGTGADQMAWSAIGDTSWSVLTTASGVGSGRLRWTRDASALLPGIYINVIQVSAGTLNVEFVDTLEVTPASLPIQDVITELLDGGVLADVHKNYLDSVGNQDGVFNLGDLLAYLVREGIQLSPVQQRRLLERNQRLNESPERDDSR